MLVLHLQRFATCMLFNVCIELYSEQADFKSVLGLHFDAKYMQQIVHAAHTLT